MRVGDKVQLSKDRILQMIKTRGPMLPVQVGKDLSVSLLFASAFLSELREDDKVKASFLRVGSSPLFYLAGQEEQLEKFIIYLNQREREAFNLLKQKKVLEDGAQTPIVRVALRAIQDFAHPMTVNLEAGQKLFWKFFSVADGEFEKTAEQMIRSVSAKEVAPIQEVKIENKQIESPQIIEVKKKVVSNVKEEIQQPLVEGEVGVEKPRARKVLKKPRVGVKERVDKKDSEFANQVREYLAGKDIEVLQSILEKKKEAEFKIRIDTIFGKQEFYLVAKEKKQVNEQDLAMAMQKAQAEKMNAIVLAPGELNARAKEHIKQWKNLVKFEKINL